MSPLNKTCTYGLRAMILLASHRVEANHPVSIRLIAGKLDVPFHFLVKILNKLTRGGMLESTRGAGGGVRLARPASSISMAEILTMLGDDKQLQGCVMGAGGFCAENPCPLHQEWAVEAGRIKNLFAETRLDVLANRALKVSECPCPLAHTRPGQI